MSELPQPPAQPPAFLWALFQQLRRRQFALGPDDFAALRDALRAGFGWSSRAELCALCCALWATSQREQDALIALFEQLAPRDLGVPAFNQAAQPELPLVPENEEDQQEPGQPLPETQPSSGRPLIPFGGVALPERPCVLLPQYPLSFREVAQAWRRLRRPTREGAPIELDVDATVARRSRAGVVVPATLVPRRYNTTRLLLLVDRQGSMTPFHSFADEVCTAIIQAGRLKRVALYYFHDQPAEGADDTVLDELSGQIAPALDAILPRIRPLEHGYVYDDPLLLQPRPLRKVLDDAAGANVVLLSDAGAARGRYDTLRLLDTLAFLKALRAHTPHIAWLNPLPRRYWANSTAAQIARHVPMFPLDRAGVYHAVNVLRGQPYDPERPL